MNTKIFKLSLFLLALTTVFISCKNDDEGVSAPIVEEDRNEQQVKDNDSILLYLSTHYYNSSFFETGTNHKYSDIIITELPLDENGAHVSTLPDPDNNTLLIDAVETRTTVFKEAEYKYYVLNLNQGGGDAPHFTDKVRVRYEGASMHSKSVFEMITTPNEILLVGDGFLTRDAIRAWQLIMPTFNTALDFGFDNGIVSYNDYGLGVMFLPSGLGYYSGVSTGSSYDNIMFKFELLQYELMDHDDDGVPSFLEDVNGDLDVTNDDTDGDGFPNYTDQDDDGDGVMTIDELMPSVYTVDTNLGEVEPILAANEFERSRSVANGIITIKTVTIVDSNNNGIPDYLDPNITINYNEVD